MTIEADVTIKLSEFELPPVPDILLIGKEAPIGPEAARRMVEAVAPGQFEVIRIEGKSFEAVVVRKRLLEQLPQEKLIEILLEESTQLAAPDAVLKGQVSVEILVKRRVQLA